MQRAINDLSPIGAGPQSAPLTVNQHWQAQRGSRTLTEYRNLLAGHDKRRRARYRGQHGALRSVNDKATTGVGSSMLAATFRFAQPR